MVSRELVAASTKPLLLALLASGESYGYELIQRVRQYSDGQLQWSDGMLYPVLHRLEQEGSIVAEWKDADNGRRRKYYRLTPAGRDALAAERRQWLAVQATLTQAWKLCSI